MIYLTGFHSMEEFIRSGKTGGARLLVANSGPRIKKIMDLAAKSGLKVFNVGQNELNTLAPDNRGAALAYESGDKNSSAIDLDSWLSGLSKKEHKVIILDHIEDPHNYGAILRSAEVFGIDLVIVPERRASRQTDVVARTSAGAMSYVPTSSVANLARAVEKLKKAGFWVYAADMKGEALQDIRLNGNTAIILGSEGAGVSRLLKENCDGFVSIPQYGRIESLNVSVAAGVIMYEMRRKPG
ncbi:23S rRNA (guanosine(2251)-2'-O)-methyltransferase RlmB [Spirochaetota bacterium]